MSVFETAVEFILPYHECTEAQCVLFHDDEGRRVRVGHTRRSVVSFLNEMRTKTGTPHLSVMGFCTNVTRELTEALTEMGREDGLGAGWFRYDDEYIELAQALNAVGRLVAPLARRTNFRRGRLTLSCPPTSEQQAWACERIEHDVQAHLYLRMVLLEQHGDPAARYRIYRPNWTSDAGRVYRHFLDGPAEISDIKGHVDLSNIGVQKAVNRLCKKGWLYRIERGVYEAVVQHDELELPLAIRIQQPLFERFKTHSREEIRARKAEREKQRHQGRQRYANALEEGG
jgi:hypothetical protein